MISWIEREQRRISKAQILLRPGIEGAGGTWADLGCGDGVFTCLLSQFLQPGSQIYAVDKNQHTLDALRHNLAELQLATVIHPVLADFTQPLALPPLDGLVMANALHFIRAKETVLRQLFELFKPGGRLIVIEYNTSLGNYAVPHPLDESGFLDLANQVGLREAQIIARAPSSFLGEMYAGSGIADRSKPG
jgi:ubiquinone/menaquinone biosynthesis C-methylase UbiE